jgi:hypothetical protein
MNPGLPPPAPSTRLWLTLLFMERQLVPPPGSVLPTRWSLLSSCLMSGQLCSNLDSTSADNCIEK